MDAACLIFAYHTALMVTFSPGVKSWGTNSQWQLLLSSTMSSPGRLASKKHNTDSRTLELVHKPPKPSKNLNLAELQPLTRLTSSVPHQTGQCNAIFIKLRDGHHGESKTTVAQRITKPYSDPKNTFRHLNSYTEYTSLNQIIKYQIKCYWNWTC